MFEEFTADFILIICEAASEQGASAPCLTKLDFAPIISSNNLGTLLL
ncbi:hypothetical protein [Nostoc sp.]